MRICSVCKLSLELDRFYVRPNRKSGLSSECKSCNLARSRRWKEANKDRLQSYRKANNSRLVDYNKWRLREKVYGINKETFYSMIEQQNNCCATCKNVFIKEPNVDHCHSTGVVRGLLCGPCNTALGLVKDNQETLSNMIRYLKLMENP